MARTLHGERGSAMTEAAIIFPCLVLILYWSAALTDVMVLKLKAAEAVRYALWETTVFKEPAQINSEVQQKFVDLRSPRDENVAYTGLLMYPLTRDMLWASAVDTTGTRVSIGGNVQLPPGVGFIGGVINLVMGAITRSVDGAMRLGKFNVHGKALARVTLVHARHDEIASPILKGGDLLGLKGGNDLDHPQSMTNFTFQAPLPSQRPMSLVFDTWKAWPKPAKYTFDGAPTDPSVSPMKTYPVVETQVSAQVEKNVFFGLTSVPFVNKVRSIGRYILAALGPLAGGSLPDVFSSARMDNSDSKDRGPITILPPEKPEVGWAPGQCDYRGSMQPCPTQRLGDLRVSSSGPAYIDKLTTLGPGVDRTRYTLPFRINTVYWSESGGTNNGDPPATGQKISAPSSKITQNNEYVASYHCRGHYFAGSQRGQETDAKKRYARSCYK
jgi:hypothetical protein